jgi:hypothetical protein
MARVSSPGDAGGCWQAACSVRHPAGLPARRAIARSARVGGPVGVEVGPIHLATLDQPVPGLTDEAGHIANSRILDNQLRRLAKLNRARFRTKQGSKNRTKLRRRRARLRAEPSSAATREEAVRETWTGHRQRRPARSG